MSIDLEAETQRLDTTGLPQLPVVDGGLRGSRDGGLRDRTAEDEDPLADLGF